MTRKVYAVTGASGWLGQACAAFLRSRGDEVRLFASSGRGSYEPLAALSKTRHDVLLHFACVTRDRLNAVGIDQFIASNSQITDQVLSAIGRFSPDVFFASSGAAQEEGTLSNNPYASIKRTDEQALSSATNGSCAIARIYNVAGPYVTKPSLFLLTDLVSQATVRRGLTLTSRRPTIRSYVDVQDLAAWAIHFAGTGRMASTRGEVEVEAMDLARLVLRVLGLGSAMQIRRPQFDPTSAAERYVADDFSWATSCAEADLSLRALDEQVLRTYQYLTRQPG